MVESRIHCVLAMAALLVTIQGIAAAGRTVVQFGGRSPSYSADFMAGYTAAVQKYQIQLQQQQQPQQQQGVAVSSPADRKLLQTGGRAPSFSPEFIAVYTAAVQKYQLQLQQQQQQQSVSSATAAMTSTADRKLLQTGGRTPGFSPEFIAAYTAAMQKYQTQIRLQQQQQQQQQDAAPSNVVDGGRKLLQTGGRAPSYNDGFMSGYTTAVRQYQALVLQQTQQQQQAQAAQVVAPASKPAGSGGHKL